MSSLSLLRRALLFLPALLRVERSPDGLAHLNVVVPALPPGEHALRSEIGGVFTPEGPVVTVH